MASNPLTYSELEAYERKALVRLSAWETDLIMRLDTAVLATWAGSVSAPTTQADREAEGIPVTDVASLKVAMRARAALHRKIAEDKAQARAAPKGGVHG